MDGAGVAGLTVATLLHDRGFEVALVDEGTVCDRSVVVAVPRKSLELIAKLWRLPCARLMVGQPVNHRCVAWTGNRLEIVAASAVILDLSVLVQVLRDVLCSRNIPWISREGNSRGQLTLVARGRAGEAHGSVKGGNRQAVRVHIRHLPGFDKDGFAIASTSVGWLFTAVHPFGGFASMLVRPGSRTELDPTLDVSRALWEAFRRDLSNVLDVMEPSLPCAPAFSYPLTDRGVLLGDAAVAIDPIRGDGVGYAARGALLAQAVLGAGFRRSALEHWVTRLAAVFVSHLGSAIKYYAMARHAEIWSAEIDAMERARARVACLVRLGAPELYLRGYQLRPISGLSLQ